MTSLPSAILFFVMAQGIIFNAFTEYNGDFAMGLARPAGAHKFASALRSLGYNIEVVDFFNYWQMEQAQKFITKHCNHETLFIGWSTSFFRPDEKFSDDLIKWIRTQYPHVKLLAGGYQPLFSNLNNLDYYIYSYAEGVIPDLMSHMKGLPNDLKADAVEGSKSLYIDSLKYYKLANWGDLQIRYQENDFIRPEESLTVEMSRGCVFQCKFCAYPITGKKGVDHIRMAEDIRKELQLNYDTYGTTSYYFSEETVNDSIIKLKALQAAVGKLNFTPEFTGFFRADLIHTYPETIQMFKDSNVVGMHFGIETFHPKAGVAIGKGLASEKIKDVIYRLRDEMNPDFRMVGSFIVGLPYEPLESIYETQNWLEKPDSPLGAWLWYPLMIPDPKAKLQSSYFSHHFEDYGYETLGLLPDDKRMLNWRLPHLDYYGAVQVRNELDERSKPFRKISPWTAVACKGLALDKNEYFYKSFVGPDKVDTTYLHNVGTQKVYEYIEKKLNY